MALSDGRVVIDQRSSGLAARWYTCLGNNPNSRKDGHQGHKHQPSGRSALSSSRVPEFIFTQSVAFTQELFLVSSSISSKMHAVGTWNKKILRLFLSGCPNQPMQLGCAKLQYGTQGKGSVWVRVRTGKCLRTGRFRTGKLRRAYKGTQRSSDL